MNSIIACTFVCMLNFILSVNSIENKPAEYERSGSCNVSTAYTVSSNNHMQMFIIYYSLLKSVCINTVQHSTVLVRKKEKSCFSLQMCTGTVKVVRIQLLSCMLQYLVDACMYNYVTKYTYICHYSVSSQVACLMLSQLMNTALYYPMLM